jgi:hypothetical protein
MSRGPSGRCLKFTTHLHLMSRLRTSGSIPLLLHAFTEWRQKTLLFISPFKSTLLSTLYSTETNIVKRTIKTAKWRWNFTVDMTIRLPQFVEFKFLQSAGYGGQWQTVTNSDTDRMWDTFCNRNVTSEHMLLDTLSSGHMHTTTIWPPVLPFCCQVR